MTARGCFLNWKWLVDLCGTLKAKGTFLVSTRVDTPSLGHYFNGAFAVRPYQFIVALAIHVDPTTQFFSPGRRTNKTPSSGELGNCQTFASLARRLL